MRPHPSNRNHEHHQPTNMNVYTLMTAARPVLRRSHQLRQINITKRQQHTKKPTLKVDDESATGNTIPVPNTVAIVPLWQRLGPLTTAFSAYGKSQRKRPLLTQFISSLIIYFCGDMSAQKINGDEYDPKRTLRALVISSGSSIPSYKWYIHTFSEYAP